MRLKHSEVKPFREQQLVRQGYCCSLCGQRVLDDAVLDHCHKTGKIRRVLHRGCNALLGKIENNMLRNRVDIERLRGIAQNLVGYLQQEYEDIVHPTHKTEEEKALLRKKRAKARRSKK